MYAIEVLNTNTDKYKWILCAVAHDLEEKITLVNYLRGAGYIVRSYPHPTPQTCAD